MVEEYQSLKKGMRLLSNFLEEQVMETDNATAVTNQHKKYTVNSNHRNNNDNSSISKKWISGKEEHYDAIMMVQNPRSDLGSVASAMWANEEDGGV